MKDIQLVLTNPCTKQWDDLQQTGAGRYCDRCEKTIIDLTGKSDVELIRFFNNKKENVCGRLDSSQLNRKLDLPSSKAGWHWLMPLAVGAIFANPAQAQTLRPVMEQSDQTAASVSSSRESAIKLPKLEGMIGGRVVDNETGKSLTGVKIRQKGFANVLAVTDSLGKFNLTQQVGISQILFVLELNGYTLAETSLRDNMLVKLATARRIVIGGVSTFSLDQQPLYLVTIGDKSCTIDPTRIKEISPDWIIKLDVLKDAAATAIYGSKGANGVILIEVLEAYADKFDFSHKK